MDANNIIQQHSSLIYPEDMTTTCEPLGKLGITYFGHAWLDKKGEVAGLSSDPCYLNHYLENKLYTLDLHTELSSANQGFIHWDLVHRRVDGEYYHQTNLDFHLNHIFTLIRSNHDGLHLYHFATNQVNDFMNSFYVGNVDLLEQFIAHYHEQLLMNPRMRRGLDLKMPMPATAPSAPIIFNYPCVSPDFREAFQNEMKSDNLKEIDFSRISLSTRERQCAHYLLQGLTSKEIALRLHISSRTIEVYFERLKARFKARNKIQLAAMLVMFASACGQ